ncbi:MAG: hypothetical protein MUC50_08110 [Myxococcota bacterium]|nr:hypothetical protein [Myxococcota bacterium]
MALDPIPSSTSSASDTGSDSGTQDSETSSGSVSQSDTGGTATDSQSASGTQDTGSGTQDSETSSSSVSQSDTAGTGTDSQTTSGTQGTASDTQDTDCPPGYDGEACAHTCESSALDILSCSNSLFNCSAWIDGKNNIGASYTCPVGQENCLLINFDFDLGQRFYIHRFRFLSDWWSKRPGNWALLASDDGVHYSLVMTGRSNRAPWQCVQGEPCTTAVPQECCPGGVTQDTSAVGTTYSKWDDFSFTGVVARYWRWRIDSTDQADWLIMNEVDFFGNACLGTRCDVPDCGTGVCTGAGPAFCACPDCQPEASCTSAWVGTPPSCTTD